MDTVFIIIYIEFVLNWATNLWTNTFRVLTKNKAEEVQIYVIVGKKWGSFFFLILLSFTILGLLEGTVG